MRDFISRVTPVLCLFGLLVTLSPTAGHAQGGPTSAIDIPLSDIETVLAVESEIPDRQIRIVDMGSYGGDDQRPSPAALSLRSGSRRAR